MAPLVSVFISSYNMARFLPQAIESVLTQRYDNYELIIVNDGSTDETAQILQPYYHHPGVIIQNNPTNLGMAAAWNVGLQLCRGEFITKLDADDFYHPDYLRRMVALAQQDDQIGLVFSGVQLIYPDGRVEPELPFWQSWTRDRETFLPTLLRLCVIRSPSVMVRRRCYEHLGRFTVAMRIHTDWEMWVRIAAHYKIGYVNELLAYYRVSYGANCTAQAAIDGRSRADLQLWFDLLAQNQLPYRFTAKEEAIFRRGVFELEMHFAGLAAYYHHDEAQQQAYTRFAEQILAQPYAHHLSPVHLNLQQGLCAFRDREFATARRFFAQAIRLNPLACARLWVINKFLLTFLGRTQWGIGFK